MAEPLFDVIAINIKTGAERMIAERRSESNAEAVITMAVYRIGVDEEIFAERPHPHKLNTEGFAASPKHHNTEE